MPRYFFHIIHHGQFIRDDEGSILPGLDAVEREAKASALDLASQIASVRQRPDDWCIEVHDIDGKIVTSLLVTEVMEHPRNPQFSDQCGGIEEGRKLH
jgi:hypothetical protein